MTGPNDFSGLSPTTLAEVLGAEQVMDFEMRPLFPRIHRIAGPAYTVRCTVGDNLMFHAAVYAAEPGSVIVAQADDTQFALAGGNVCRIAKERGLAGFVIDGVVRDMTEICALQFPVFARGASPIPGVKKLASTPNPIIRCGGVKVHSSDWIVADEDGIVVVPLLRRAAVLKSALAKFASESNISFEDWKRYHYETVQNLLRG